MARKGMMTVWQPGTGAQWWATGLTLEDFKQRDAALFKDGLRLAAIDVYRYRNAPKRYSYSGVWRPGRGSQFWRAGMSVSAFKAEDLRQVKAGRRIALMHMQDSKVFAVWQPGSGAQFWRTGMNADQLRRQDKKYFEDGLRLVYLGRYGKNSFAAVWQPGTGGQWARWGMDYGTFKLRSADYFKQGMRLVSLDTYDGKFVAVWRPGAGAQLWRTGVSTGDLKVEDLKHFKKGRRLKVLRAKRLKTEPTYSGSRPPQSSHSHWATVENNVCYNLDGSVSSVNRPGRFSATASGRTLNEARENAKTALMGQGMCLTTAQERKPGCCTYRFK